MFREALKSRCGGSRSVLFEVRMTLLLYQLPSLSVFLNTNKLGSIGQREPLAGSSSSLVYNRGLREPGPSVDDPITSRRFDSKAVCSYHHRGLKKAVVHVSKSAFI